ncbi:unnamed protein product [Sphagnum jensenii]|uniref:Uncharacterized protein n=1 Tax=Sphagnum jensenii TaxID=128206 RepID=A0ABP0XCF0_9BRYO
MQRSLPGRIDKVTRPGSDGGHNDKDIHRLPQLHDPPSRQHKVRWKRLRLQIWPISFRYLPSPLPYTHNRSLYYKRWTGIWTRGLGCDRGRGGGSRRPLSCQS